METHAELKAKYLGKLVSIQNRQRFGDHRLVGVVEEVEPPGHPMPGCIHLHCKTLQGQLRRWYINIDEDALHEDAWFAEIWGE